MDNYIEKKNTFGAVGCINDPKDGIHTQEKNITCEEEIIYQSQFCGGTRMKLKLQLC